MTARKSLLRGLAVLCWVGALGGVPSTWGAASSASLDAYGWWNRNQALPVQGDPTGLGVVTVPTVPAPPTVPEDGLYVANDSSGPSAIAAVRYRLESQAAGSLTITLADGSALTGTEELVGCPALGGFEPAQNGRWDAAPAYDPEACVVVPVASEDGSALKFDIPATFTSALGDVSLVLAPAPGSVTPFSLAFDAPTDDSFTVTSTPPPSSSPTPVGGSPVPSAAPAFTAPVPPSFSAPSSPAPAAPEVAEEDEVAAPVAEVASPPVAAAVAEESRAASVVAVMALLAVGGGLWWLSGKPARAPRLLGSVGGASAASVEAPAAVPASAQPPRRGIGRFARPRTSPPTPI